MDAVIFLLFIFSMILMIALQDRPELKDSPFLLIYLYL